MALDSIARVRHAATLDLGERVTTDSAIAATPQPVTYVRRLGVWDASMVVVGGVIGSGIFLTPAAIARQTG